MVSLLSKIASHVDVAWLRAAVRHYGNPNISWNFFYTINFMPIFSVIKAIRGIIFRWHFVPLADFENYRKDFTLRACPRCPLAALSGACGSICSAAPRMPSNEHLERVKYSGYASDAFRSPPKALKAARPENNILIIFRSSSRELAGVFSRSA